MDLALGTLSLLTVDLALRSFTDWVADCWADWVIALPAALRVAVTFYFSDSCHEVSLSMSDCSEAQQGEHNEDEQRTHRDGGKMDVVDREASTLLYYTMLVTVNRNV
jgi:hypothetical protein